MRPALRLIRWWRRPTWPTASLRTYLVLLLLLATVPIAVLMGHQIVSNVSAQESRMKEELRRNANSLAQTVEREIASSTDALAILAQTDSLQRGDVVEFESFLNRSPVLRTSWSSAFLLDAQAQGRVLFNTSRLRVSTARGPDPAEVERMLDARRPYVSNLVVDGQHSRYATVVSVPVYVGAELRYLLGVWIPVSVWQDLIQQSGPPVDGFNTVFDARHVVIARTLQPERWVGERLPAKAVAMTEHTPQGAMLTDLLGGGSTYTAWQHIPAIGWGVSVGIPSRPVLLAQRETMAIALATAIGCIVLGVMLALSIARRVTGPLHALATPGVEPPSSRIHVREISGLHDALLIARAQDQFAREGLQRKADEFETLFNSSPIGLAFALDRDCGEVLYNPAMRELLGLTGADGEGARQVLHRGEPLPPGQQPLQRAAATGEAVGPVELELRASGQPPVHVIANAAPLRTPAGEPRGAIGAVVDISARKQAEQSRAQLMTLEQRARMEAEAANRAKDEFLAMLGHELRNPLSAMASAVDVLERSPSDSELAATARTVISRQTTHLSHLMDDLLDVARVISGKVLLSRRPLDLGALLARVAETLRVTGEGRQHTVTVETTEVWIDADPTRMEQVVNNLLTNAIKYTPPGGRITLSVVADGDAAALRVADNGLGIPPALLPHIFELFVQGERTLDRRAGGLGIGLTLVRRIVELHGGSVRVDSSSAGSTFEVRLARTPKPPPAPEAVSAHGARSLRVLVVDDNADALTALRSMLSLDGHDVLAAVDGQAGLAALVDERPDAAVVDIGLPLLDGYGVAKQARAAGYPGRLIALSGYGQGGDVRRALAAGFDAHLVKPVVPKQLKALLHAS